MVSEFLEVMEPQILEVAGIVVGAVITLTAARLRKWTGLKIEQQHRDALHKAIMSGVKAATAAAKARKVTEAEIVNAAISHARASVPDAIKKLKPTDDVLVGLALRYSDDKGADQ